MYISYKKWFSLVYDFCTNINLINSDIEFDTTQEYMEKIEKELSINIGLVPKLYFQYFGNSKKFNCEYFIEPCYIFENIISSYFNSPVKEKILNSILNQKHKLGINHEKISKEDVFIIDHYLEGGCYTFFLLGSDNPKKMIFWGEGAEIQQVGSFIDYLRVQLLQGLIAVIKEQVVEDRGIIYGCKVDKDKLFESSWTKFHKDMILERNGIYHASHAITRFISELREPSDGVLEWGLFNEKFIQFLVDNRELQINKTI